MARGLRVKRQIEQPCEAEPGCEALVGARHFAARTIPFAFQPCCHVLLGERSFKVVQHIDLGLV